MGACRGCACDAATVKKEASRVGTKTAGCVGGVCGGFRDFILRGNVIDLAVAVVVGTSFTALVNALVADFLTPLIGAGGGRVIFDPNSVFGDLTFTINGSVFRYGHFLNTVLSFVLVCTVLYFVVVLPFNKLVKLVKKDGKKTRECPECASDVPTKARRCKFCCAAIEPLPEPAKSGRGSKTLLLTDQDEVITKSPAPGPPTGLAADARSASAPAVCKEV